jgi:DNA mismatch repair protein MutS
MDGATTPMMQQWQACKERAGDALLLFRLGDFYEAFYEDAHLLAQELDLTLTQRQQVPMAGIPVHAAQGYLDRLMHKGLRVAIAEQIEEPGQSSKLMRREVVRVLTAGTAVESSLVCENAYHYIASLAQVGGVVGLAVVETSTGSFRATELEESSALAAELGRLAPAELLICDCCEAKYRTLLQEGGYRLTLKPDWYFDHETARELLGTHFGVRSLDGFGLRGMVAAVSAAGSLLSYLQRELCLPTSHLTTLSTYRCIDFLFLDPVTQKNLLLVGDGDRQSSTLLGLLNRTQTAMGSRLLREWVVRPLLRVDEIAVRQELVQLLLENSSLQSALREALGKIGDLERLAVKVNAGWATPRDLRLLGESLLQLPAVAQLIRAHPSLGELDPLATALHQLGSKVEQTLREELPLRASEGGLIRDRVCPELDELRTLQQRGTDYLAQYQSRLREMTQIKSLKVGYNRVFGYYVEVSKGQAERIPKDFVRRQTLSNAERFISTELKEYEAKALNAAERITALETELFNALRQEVAGELTAIHQAAHSLARLDTLQALAHVAQEKNYKRPLVDNSLVLLIRGGRHPVVEEKVGLFVPNDTLLHGEGERLALITGPNMAGKSTYIRQVALLVLMAQIGSFVPAEESHIGIVDKVFTRIGAGDDLARGQSTFMVEMTETANIIHHATPRSLVILDEVGRGTSTYDGVAIAWAVAEHLAVVARARTLFATHYFELTQLEAKIKGVVNYNVAVTEENGRLLFSHRIVRGHADQSYGIHVARLAGLPQPLILRAIALLQELEQGAPASRLAQKQGRVLARDPKEPFQLTLFA